MKSFKTWAAIVWSVAIASVVILFFTKCASMKVVDAAPARLVSYDKQKLSTNFNVTIKTDTCNYFTGKWNAHCWQCEDAKVPERWNVKKMKDGSYLIEPVK